MDSSEKPKRERRVYNAREKCQAVLALWTGRRRHSELCREMSVPPNLLSGWQERAVEGMLRALEPQSRRQEERGPMLDPHLEKLLERKVQRLTTRIARLGTKPKPGTEKPTP